MDSQELRKKFLEFFHKRGHKIVPSSSLIPDDPSVLFTTAGMQQFKRYYTGELDPLKDFSSKNVCSIQKCFRTSDINEVGDESHLTFFEMLGNFSFGGYWKEETIKYAWEFLTEELKIEPKRISASVFAGDKDVSYDSESFEILKKLGINKVEKGNREDNFWGPTGKQGPCGPTVEFYIDGVELWNLVFNEYYCRENSKLEALKQKGVDTGMGLERLAMIVQGKKNIFETDLFKPFIQVVPHKDIENEARAARIIVDHIRGSLFLVSDDVLPSNVTQGYILRRLLRRAMRYGKVLGLEKDFLIPLADKTIETYKKFHPELATKREDILAVIQKEEEKFSVTLERGLKEFEKFLFLGKALLGPRPKKVLLAPKNIITGEEAFYLYESFGFPIELTRELAQEHGFIIDESGWDDALKKHREISRAGVEKKFGGHGLILDTGELKAGNEEEIKKVMRLHTATHLLNQALHDVLGDEVDQRGSDITPQRTRFDFVLARKMTPEEIKKVEVIVNEKIKENLPVRMKEMPFEKAMKLNVRKFYKGKYPAIAKVYYIGETDDVAKAYSKELCGGPHVSRTGEIGKFKIIKEETSSAGVRRIRAVVE